MGIMGTASNWNIVVHNIAGYMITMNSDNSHFGVKYNPITGHVLGEMMAYQMLYVVNGSLLHNRLYI